jgi:hypothetical protein
MQKEQETRPNQSGVKDQVSQKPPAKMSNTSSPREPKLSNESERMTAYGDEDLNLANYQRCWDKIYRRTIRQIEQIKGMLCEPFLLFL